MKDHSGVVLRLGPLQHGEIVHRAGILDGIVGEGHILGGEGLPVGELHIVPNRDRPREPVLAHLHAGSQIVTDGQVWVGHRKGGLDQRLVDVLPRPPAESRIKARFRLRSGGHNHCDGRFLLRLS